MTLQLQGEILSSSLAYAEARWSVVPIAPRSKQPLLAWLEFQQRRALPEEIRGWFQRWPGANLAVVTGAISNIVVIDIDARHAGEAALQLLEDDAGPVPSTLEATTGGGGRHLYFAHPSRPVRNRAGLRPGICCGMRSLPTWWASCCCAGIASAAVRRCRTRRRCAPSRASPGCTGSHDHVKALDR